jgi:hypothetical protein
MATAKQMPHVTSEETRQWINDLIQKSINDGSYVAEPKKPREPLPPDAGHSTRFTRELLERMERRDEQLK